MGKRVFNGVAVAILAVATVALSQAASAQAGDAARGLTAMRELNLIVLGDLATQQHAQGKVFVGGSVTGKLVAAQGGSQGYRTSDRAQLTIGGSTNGFQVESALGQPITVLVGGAASGMGINGRGSVSVGGSANVAGFNPSATKLVYYGGSVDGGQVQDAPFLIRNSSLAGLGASIGAETRTLTADLKALSSGLAQLQPLSTITSTVAALDYSRAANGFAVFGMTAGAFQDQNADFDRLFASLPNGITTVINVAGTSLNQGGNINLKSINQSVIWNFADATSLTVKGWQGSILAPDALLTNSSAIEGSVVARAMAMNGEVHLGTFDGTANIVQAPVPEPAGWATMLTGFAVAGGLLRRRARRASLAAA